MIDISAYQTTVNSSYFLAIYATLAAFVLSTVVAFTYEKTFQGLSYSRNFVQSLILGSIVVCLAMQAIGNNLAYGLGMMGALTIIRFRTGLKDPRDMIFIFAGLAIGMATGVHAYSAAIVGTLGFCLAAFSLFNTGPGKNRYFDGLIRFNLIASDSNANDIQTKLQTHCNKFALVTMRESTQGERLDYAYQIKFKKDENKQLLVNDLKKIPTIKNLHLLLQETTVEL